MMAKFDVAETMSVTATSFALDRGDNFPFVTMPDFERRSQKVREMSGAELVILAPLVNRTLEVQWIEYAQTNSAWIRQGLDLQGLFDVDPGPVPSLIHPFEYDGDEHPGLEHMVAPCW
jgi:hypothetical protein